MATKTTTKTSKPRARKSDALSVDEMAARILERWNEAEQWMRAFGADWYPSARRWAEMTAADTGYSLEVVAAVIAAYSPQTRWIDNLLDADNLVRGKGTRRGVMGANHRRAIAALAGGIGALGNGPKINAFARNILSDPDEVTVDGDPDEVTVDGDPDEVTVDVWAARAAFGTMDKTEAATMLGWVGAYELVAAAYQKAAATVGISASVMQATVWIQIRGKAD